MNISPNDCTANMPPRRGEFQAGAVRLCYLEWGADGAPLLYLHGITSSARSLWRVAPALVAQGYRVYALDLPGHGQSDEAGDNRIEHTAALAGDMIRALGLEDAVLIGHSWGGAAALALATADERPVLAQVVLIDPALHITQERGETVLPGFLTGLGQPPEETLPGVRAANPSWHECDVYWKGEALQQCRATTVRGVLGAGWDLTARLAQVEVPLLLLVADLQHTVISAETLAAAEQALRPGLGRLVIVPGTDHNMLRGGYDLTMPLLMEWLSRA